MGKQSRKKQLQILYKRAVPKRKKRRELEKLLCGENNDEVRSPPWGNVKSRPPWNNPGKVTISSSYSTGAHVYDNVTYYPDEVVYDKPHSVDHGDRGNSFKKGGQVKWPDRRKLK